jgi:hypothetical protein
MQRSKLRFWLAAVALAPAVVSAAGAAGERISFVSCPVIRDTRSVPCWITQYDGDTYYLTIQSDVSAAVQPPMLGHQVLVEGVVSDAPSICGGIVLDPVRLSVMPERDASCNTMLPADDRYTIDFNPRPPGPSAGRLAFAPIPRTRQAAPPPAPEGPQSVDLYFDFDKGVSFRHPGELSSILSLANRLPARKVKITGVRGAHLHRRDPAPGVCKRRQTAGGRDCRTVAGFRIMVSASGMGGWRKAKRAALRTGERAGSRSFDA